MTPLYQRAIEFDGPHRAALREAWEPTPWMLVVNTDFVGSDREHDILAWCHEQFGRELWAPGQAGGYWRRGGATINGQTWFGFSTEERMNQFKAKWGGDEQ